MMTLPDDRTMLLDALRRTVRNASFELVEDGDFGECLEITCEGACLRLALPMLPFMVSMSGKPFEAKLN